jgi:hypothetical protein
MTACDSGVAFPGFDEKPDTEKDVSPADGHLPPPPVIPAETPPQDTLTPTQPETETTAPETPDEPVLDGIVVDETPEQPTEQPENNLSSEETATDDDGSEETPLEAGEASDALAGVEETDTPASTDEESTAPNEDQTAEDTLPLPPADEVPPVEPAFSYHAPGDLTPGSGQGSPDETVYAPDMVFPIKDARAFPQSMVFQPGGFRYDGDLPGDECIPENYEYPWRDNFCERGRPASFKSASCPAGSGVHLGQDIRVGDSPTCNAQRRQHRTNTQAITNYKVVAAEDGVISNISSYTVSLRAGPRTYRYLHMNMRALQVSIGDIVTAGQHIGYVSKDFGGTPTTFHLHFVLKINTAEGSVFVPPYTSLVESYARREGAPGRQIERSVNIASDVLSYDPEEVFEFVE